MKSSSLNWLGGWERGDLRRGFNSDFNKSLKSQPLEMPAVILAVSRDPDLLGVFYRNGPRNLSHLRTDTALAESLA